MLKTLTVGMRERLTESGDFSLETTWNLRNEGFMESLEFGETKKMCAKI